MIVGRSLVIFSTAFTVGILTVVGQGDENQDSLLSLANDRVPYGYGKESIKYSYLKKNGDIESPIFKRSTKLNSLPSDNKLKILDRGRWTFLPKSILSARRRKLSKKVESSFPMNVDMRSHHRLKRFIKQSTRYVPKKIVEATTTTTTTTTTKPIGRSLVSVRDEKQPMTSPRPLGRAAAAGPNYPKHRSVTANETERSMTSTLTSSQHNAPSPHYIQFSNKGRSVEEANKTLGTWMSNWSQSLSNRTSTYFKSNAWGTRRSMSKGRAVQNPNGEVTKDVKFTGDSDKTSGSVVKTYSKFESGSQFPQNSNEYDTIDTGFNKTFQISRTNSQKSSGNFPEPVDQKSTYVDQKSTSVEQIFEIRSSDPNSHNKLFEYLTGKKESNSQLPVDYLTDSPSLSLETIDKKTPTSEVNDHSINQSIPSDVIDDTDGAKLNIGLDIAAGLCALADEFDATGLPPVSYMPDPRSKYMDKYKIKMDSTCHTLKWIPCVKRGVKGKPCGWYELVSC